MWDVKSSSKRENSIPIMNASTVQLLNEASFGFGPDHNKEVGSTPITKESTEDKEEKHNGHDKEASKGDNKSSARNVSGIC